MPACVPLSQHRQSSKLRGLHVELPRDPSFKNAHTFLLVTHHRSRISHMCLSRPFSISMRHTSWSSESSRARAAVPLLCFAEPSLSVVELQSFLIWTRPEFPDQVITGSWAPLHTSRAGSSGYSASFLAMGSSYLLSLALP